MSAASDVLHRLEEDLELMELGKKEGELVRLCYGGAFGVLGGVVDMQPASHESLRMVVKGADGNRHVIVAPVSQCSFMLSIVVADAGEERVILGFKPE